MTKDIVIVGAGVVGLTCAWILAEEGFHVKIIANKVPSSFKDDTNFTSPWAGAHFRPFPANNAGDLKDFPMTRTTFAVFKEIAYKYPESSVSFMKGVDYVEADEEPYTRLNPGYAEGLESFQVLDSRTLPANVKFGSMYETWCLNAPLYLQFLERRLRMYYGVEFVTATLISLQQVSLNFPGATIINCSGMGLQYKGGYDKACFQVRGQTLLVRVPKDCIYKNMTVTHRLSNEAFSFVIPRPCDGGVIVGGTRQPGNMASTPSLDDTENPVKHAVERFPELLVYKEGIPTLDIVKVNVGFRPMRKGGVRLEKEIVGKATIIHCYGFGSSGFEMSWGAAKHVSNIIDMVCSKL